MSEPKSQILFSEVIFDRMFDFGKVVKEVGLISRNGGIKFVKLGVDIEWSLIIAYSACKTVDLAKIWNLKEHSPLHVWFQFNEIDNLGVSLKVEDRKMSLNNRILRSQTVTYDGSSLVVDRLKTPRYMKVFLDISQTIRLENYDEGVKCKRYPTTKFRSYRECDEDFVYNKMKTEYKIMPFWAARTLDEVTQKM